MTDGVSPLRVLGRSDEELAHRLMDAGFTHLIFSIPRGAADQMLRMLDICACLARQIAESNDARRKV